MTEFHITSHRNTSHNPPPNLNDHVERLFSDLEAALSHRFRARWLTGSEDKAALTQFDLKLGRLLNDFTVRALPFSD